MIPLVGFLPATDPRMVSTVEAIQRELTEDGFVLRYNAAESQQVDGLQGHEGAFLACSFWMADCLHLMGRHDEAVELFERLIALRNDLGLLSEEYDARLGRQVGNFPQAFSHVSLVNTAYRLSGQSVEDHRVSEVNQAMRRRRSWRRGLHPSRGHPLMVHPPPPGPVPSEQDASPPATSDGDGAAGGAGAGLGVEGSVRSRGRADR
jgi:hypothetical protein